MKIGLTGSIACGKSTVSQYLRQKGCFIVDADAISRALTTDGGAALPAGLERADGDVPPQRIAVSPGSWLVQVSDGVAGEDDEWLQDLLAGWDGTSPRALAEELLRQSVQRTGGADDCAVLVLAVDGKADPHRV